MKKTYFWIIIVILFLVYLYFQIKYFIDNIDFGYDFKDIDFSKINFSDLKKGESYTTITVNVYVINNTPFDLVFSDPKIDAYYNNQLIAKTSKVLEIPGLANNTPERITLRSGKRTDFLQKIDVLINKSTFELLYRIKTNVPYIVDYRVKLKAFDFFNVSYTDVYNSES